MVRKREIKMARGEGTTTRQMQEAPQNAVFIWCNDVLEYPRRVAARIGRTDLKIVGPVWLDDERWRGLEPTSIVADHALILDGNRRVSYQRALIQVRPYSTAGSPSLVKAPGS